jgi:hypothetical protein
VPSAAQFHGASSASTAESPPRWREGRLDAAVGELDRLVQRLADAAAAAEDNPADPFTVETPHRPVTNSGP